VISRLSFYATSRALLKVQAVATDGVAWSACVCVCLCPWALQKQLKRSRCRLAADLCGPKEPFIRLGQCWNSPFAATAMRHFVKILWPLVKFACYQPSYLHQSSENVMHPPCKFVMLWYWDYMYSILRMHFRWISVTSRLCEKEQLTALFGCAVFTFLLQTFFKSFIQSCEMPSSL